jgi:hypothetical protein
MYLPLKSYPCAVYTKLKYDKYLNERVPEFTYTFYSFKFEHNLDVFTIEIRNRGRIRFVKFEKQRKNHNSRCQWQPDTRSPSENSAIMGRVWGIFSSTMMDMGKI